MTATWNTKEHPNAVFMFDIDGAVHITDGFGFPWCEQEDVVMDGHTAPPEDVNDVCDACRAAASDEGLLIGDEG